MSSKSTRLARGITECVAFALSLALPLAATTASAERGEVRSRILSSPPAVVGDTPLGSLAESAGRLRGGRIQDARLTIFKRQHLLVVWAEDEPLKGYRVELGADPFAPKERSGDRRTPEGEYYICERRDDTRYHRALLISYPNEVDAVRGLSEGRIDIGEARAIRRAIASRECPPQDTALGGLILIHGQHPTETAYWEELRRVSGRVAPPALEAGDRDPAASFAFPDWTLGCVALRNQDVRELFDLLPVGTRVTIRNDH